MKVTFIKKVLVFPLVFTMLLGTANFPSVSAEETPEPSRKTPIMGWSSWNKFRAEITEEKFHAQIDAMKDLGLVDLGYTYFNVDDGFQDGRNPDSPYNVQHSTTKFPSGMKALADYIHSKGMKAGIYSDAGELTCGYLADNQGNNHNVGLYGYDEQDLRMYLIDWGYDFIKVDWCGGVDARLDRQERYTAIGNEIKKIEQETGKDKIYNICCWSFPGAWAVNVADSWRTGGDIAPDFGSILYQIDQIKGLAHYVGPGHVNDLDMLQVGNGMNYQEDKSHFSMWALMSSPLLLGMDVTTMSEETLSIIKNEEIIALNQDPACLQARVAKTVTGGEIWQKPLISADSGTKAVALLNRSDSPQEMTVNWADVGLKNVSSARDLWAHQDFSVGDSYTTTVPAHGIVVLKVEGDKLADSPNFFGAPTITKTATTLTATSQMMRTASGIDKVNLVASVYDENGVLKKMKSADSTITTSLRAFTSTLDVPDDFKGTLKVFYWNSDKSLNNPMTESYSYELPLKAEVNNLPNNVGPIAAKDMVKNGALLIDVRTEQEYNSSHINGSINISHDELISKASTLPADKNAPIIVYCASAKRSAQAQSILGYLGYSNVYNLGSMSNWNTAPSLSISASINKYIFPNDNVTVNYILNQNDTAEVKCSYGAASTIADAVSVDSFRIPANANGKGVVKAYLVYNDEVYAETSHEFDIYVAPTIPTVSPFAYASDLSHTWENVTIGWGIVGIDVSVSDDPLKNNPLRIAGNLFPKGIGTHATSEITMPIPSGSTRFVAVVGCDDKVKGTSTAPLGERFYTNYSVYIDDVLVKKTLDLDVGMYDVIDIAIPAGAQKIKLVSGDADDSLVIHFPDGRVDHYLANRNDHSDWGIAGFLNN